MKEYGEYLEMIPDDCEWMAEVASEQTDNSLWVAMGMGHCDRSYSKERRALFTLGLDMRTEEEGFALFRELLNEYTS